MKKFSLLLLALLAISALQAQKITRLNLEFRGDWQLDSQMQLSTFDSDKRESVSNFSGKFANFRMDGTLSENLSYSFRYRINKVQSNPFASTDWATLTYATDKWEFSGGKQVVAIGGYEYDRAPIDIYFASEYWHQIACYQFGVSAAYKFGSTKFLAQVCQSPYDFANQGLYAYNLMLSNANTLSSLNVLEYAPGKFAGYIALGLREVFGSVAVELDTMYRNDLENVKGSSSFSAMLDVNWAVNEKFNLFAHASFDENNSENMFDPTVPPGTSLWHVGGGVEYFPMGNRDVRIHAASSYVAGDSLVGNALHNGDFMFQMGLTWRINLIH